MKNSENEKRRIVQLLTENEHSKCTVCGTFKTQATYRYKPQQFVPNHPPKTLQPVCRKCVYKEVYGSKNFNKKMKERTLDGEK